ncbi:glycosyltransferase family 2 protein [Chloroflexota bacterium]
MNQTGPRVFGDELPRITVVMPSYNQVQYLEEAIQSILEQDYANLEFMILDGGSTDGSREIIERYSDRLAYWHSRPDKGQTDALIQGFERATGHLMGWVNSDDVLLPRALHSIAQAYVSNPEGGLIGGNYVLTDADSRIVRCKRHPANPAWFARLGLFLVNQPGSFFAPQSYRASGGLNIELHYVMDNDLYVRLLLGGTRFIHIDRFLAGFRVHPLAKTASANRSRAIAEYKYAQRKYWPEDATHANKQSFGRGVYIIHQVVTGNYLRMAIETCRFHGQHWRNLYAEQEESSR